MHLLSTYLPVALSISSLISLVSSQAAPLACPQSSKKCSTTLKTSGGGICNVAGSVGEPSLLSQCKYTAFENCRNLCLSNLSCTSFSWDSLNGQCSLYKKPISEMKFKSSATTSKFYGRGCYVFTCAPVTSTVVSTTKVVSTSTITKTTTQTATASSVSTDTPNAGFSVGFGPGWGPYGSDPTYIMDSGVGIMSSGLTDDPYFCSGGGWCKMIEFDNRPGGYMIIGMKAPVKTLPADHMLSDALFHFHVKVDQRKKYQVNDCIINLNLYAYDEQGTLLQAYGDDPHQQISWGPDATYEYLFTTPPFNGVAVSAIWLHCEAQDDTTKVPVVYLDNWSMTMV